MIVALIVARGLVSRERLEAPQPIVHVTMSAPEAEAISRKLLEQI
jgi:hypothetical protein